MRERAQHDSDPDAAAGEGSATAARSKAEPAGGQLDLWAGIPAPPIETSLEAARTRARALVSTMKARRCCLRCGADGQERRLLFVHRRPHTLNVPVARLVQWGVSNARIREEVARCDAYCARCWLGGTWNPTPKMLRLATIRPVGVVAKAAITRCGGRKPTLGHSREDRRKRA